MRASEKTLDDLGTRAADMAMKGAVDLLIARGFKTLRTMPTENVESLLEIIRGEIRDSLDGALADARAAFDAGMGGFASATFGASMTLAGTRAAKRFLGEAV